MSLEKRVRIAYNPVLSIRIGGTFKIDTSARPKWPGNRLCARGCESIRLEKHESSPRPAARDGMEQEPYEFRSCPAKPESKGKASSRCGIGTHEKTIGTFRTHAFLASKERGFHHADHDSGLLGVRSVPQVFW